MVLNGLAVVLNPKQLELLQELVDKGLYKTRQEAVRDAIRRTFQAGEEGKKVLMND